LGKVTHKPWVLGFGGSFLFQVLFPAFLHLSGRSLFKFPFPGYLTPFRSVADRECLSRIPDLDFYPSRIPDLGSRIQKQQKEREEKKFVVIGTGTFFVATNFTKFKIILLLKC
jgi:hypothetical protein